MERSQFLPSSRMRLGELVVWDCVLAFFVVGIVDEPDRQSGQRGLDRLGIMAGDDDRLAQR